MKMITHPIIQMQFLRGHLVTGCILLHPLIALVRHNSLYSNNTPNIEPHVVRQPGRVR